MPHNDYDNDHDNNNTSSSNDDDDDDDDGDDDRIESNLPHNRIFTINISLK